MEPRFQWEGSLDAQKTVLANNVAPFYMEKSELVTLIVALVVAVVGGIAIVIYVISRREKTSPLEQAIQNAREDIIQELYQNSNNNSRPSELSPNEENALVDEIIMRFANGNVHNNNEYYINSNNGNLSRGLEGHRRKQRRRRSRKSKRV